MDKMNKQDRSAGVENNGWLRRRIVPILTLLLVIGIVVSVFYVVKDDPQRLEGLKAYGYLGVFITSLILNATVILPVGNVVLIIALGAALPSATLVGLAGGVGAAIGEITGYIAGRSGRTILHRGKTYARLERWVKKWGAPAIFVLSLFPFFFDLAGIAAGALRLPLWKFLLACWLGRTVLYLSMAWAGAQGWEVILPGLNF